MKKCHIYTLSGILLIFFLLLSAGYSSASEEVVDGDRFFVSGVITDTHEEPVQEARVKLLVNGKPHNLLFEHKSSDEIETSSHGTYQAEFRLPPGQIETAAIQIKVSKTSYKKTSVDLTENDFARKGENSYTVKNIEMPRILGPAFYISAIIFVLAYILISFELLHRTLAAMLGAVLMLIITYTAGTINPDYHILSFDRAMHAIDMNVVFLLMGMMIIVGILKHTGIFQWCAYKAFKMSRGNVMLLSVILMIFTAIASAFLDNVTTMLLLTPVTIEIAITLGISPLLLLMPEILASNIGGTATLIGDPPNIMIGSYVGLTFMQFVKNLAMVCVVSIGVLFVYTKIFYGKQYAKAKIDDIDGFIAKLKEEYQITDKTLLGFGLCVLGLVVGLFVTHGYWHMEVSVAALFGAGILFTYGVMTKRINMIELIERDIEWATLLFFMFLFMLVGAVEETGLLALIADYVLELSKGNLTVAICLVLWVSAIMSAFVDNIPFTATMLPVTAYLTQVIPGAAESNVLWWALALGACFGGNGTIIGASANVVTIGIAEAAGYRITFFQFMKVAFIYMIITVAIANAWLLIFLK